ncbi:DUF2931 family protein [Flavobacterium sp. ALJ2]|uniref:DUF2931 family protein n=1 Tax=Flavobacterium sp. ALJ2 TaxID=2786960 RepID=UPI0018A03F51|nr:DUF2931 family protein [Flavobacterium sp. ALJ2]MBF7093600.1 DUF2931 family protein [Flavobacterium sp. ALJ2]
MNKSVKLLMLITLLNLTLASCQKNMEQKEYSWTAAACTPKNYPAEIFSGHLLLGTKPNSAYVYMPFDRIIDSENLGENGGSSSGLATGTTPKILDITWMSYTENKSYSGVFNLDSDKIEALMINGSERPYWDVATKKVGIVKDYRFVINTGLFPGGIVVLYVFSQSNMTIVGRYQAHEDKNVDWKVAHKSMTDQKGIDEYVNYMNEDLPQEIKDQIKNGTIPFGYWDTLFQTYSLTPLVKAEDKVETIKLNYINGEFESIFLSLNNNVMPIKKRAAPRKMNIVWHDINDRRMESDVYFDEKKIKALFEQTKPNEPIQFVIEIDRNTKPRETTGILIKLKTNDREIDLQKAIVSQETFTKSIPY